MNALFVFLGGGLGALVRYAIAQWLPPVSLRIGQFPWATLTANLLACTLLGIGLALLARGHLPRPAQLLLLTGFCGGFSTFSTFAAELLELLQGGHWPVAAAYLLTSLLMGIGSLFLSLQLLVD